MVVVSTGVVKLLPVLRAVPPDAAAYHVTVPAQPVAVSVAVWPLLMVDEDTAGAAGSGFTVAVAAVRLLVQPLVQST